ESDSSGNLYGLNWSGNLFSLDKTTGQATYIGFTGLYGAMDLAFDNSGTLWAVDGNGYLWTVDPATGVGTFRTYIYGLNGYPMGLMVDPTDNVMYATTYTSSSILYSVDPATGSSLAVGPVGVPYPHGGDFAPTVIPGQDVFRVDVAPGQGLTLEAT